MRNILEREGQQKQHARPSLYTINSGFLPSCNVPNHLEQIRSWIIDALKLRKRDCV